MSKCLWLFCSKIFYDPVTSERCFKDFPLAVRLGFPRRAVSKAITKLLQKFEWKRIGIIYDSDVLGEKVRQLLICTYTPDKPESGWFNQQFPGKMSDVGQFSGLWILLVGAGWGTVWLERNDRASSAHQQLQPLLARCLESQFVVRPIYMKSRHWCNMF